MEKNDAQTLLLGCAQQRQIQDGVIMLLCLWLQTHLTFSSLTFCSFSASKLSLILFMLASFSPITFLAIYKTFND